MAVNLARTGFLGPTEVQRRAYYRDLAAQFRGARLASATADCAGCRASALYPGRGCALDRPNDTGTAQPSHRTVGRSARAVADHAPPRVHSAVALADPPHAVGDEPSEYACLHQPD